MLLDEVRAPTLPPASSSARTSEHEVAGELTLPRVARRKACTSIATPRLHVERARPQTKPSSITPSNGGCFQPWPAVVTTSTCPCSRSGGASPPARRLTRFGRPAPARTSSSRSPPPRAARGGSRYRRASFPGGFVVSTGSAPAGAHDRHTARRARSAAGRPRPRCCSGRSRRARRRSLQPEPPHDLDRVVVAVPDGDLAGGQPVATSSARPSREVECEGRDAALHRAEAVQLDGLRQAVEEPFPSSCSCA